MRNWRQEVADEFTRRHRTVDDNVVEEMAQHAAAAWEAARADGEAPGVADARVRALVTSWCEGTSGPSRIQRVPLVESAGATASPFAGLSLDVRQALRLLRRQPGVACLSVVMIALGIGVTSSLFSIVNGVLLRPLPWKAADRLVRVYENRAGMSARRSGSYWLTNITYHAWADHPQTIDGVAGWRDREVLVAGDAGLDRVRTASVTTTLFPLLGESPLLGANFTAADARADNTVILSYGFWLERFGGARDVLGKQLSLDGRSRTIIAVMPRGFEFPTHEVRVWTPLDMYPAYTAGNRHIEGFNGLARLKPGITPDQAAAEATARLNATGLADLSHLPDMFGSTGARVTSVRMLDWVVSDVKPALWILLAAGGLLLVAAIGTVVNLQLAQATARGREVAVRSAIGAGTSRLARQLFVETTTMAAIGGALGLGLTLLLLRVLPTLLPSDFPRAEQIGVDARVLALVAGLTLAVSLAIGLLPARMARRATVTSALAEEGNAPIGQSLRSPAARSRALIITAQVAIAAVLLVGAALLSKSFTRLLDADRGYTLTNLLTARIAFQGAGLPAGSDAAFFREVLERAAALPGVAHVGLADRLPLATANWLTWVALDPRRQTRGSTSSDDRVLAVYRIVSEDYFSSMGMRLVSGRGFTTQDTASSEPVVVVNQTFARQYLPGDPLGALIDPHLEQYRPRSPRWRVVGVVSDVRSDGPTEPVQPELYASTGQTDFPAQFVTVRTKGDPAALAADLRAIVRAASRNAAIDQVLTMEGWLRTSLARPRLYVVLIGGFSSFAVLIAGIGLFGGLSYGVTQRRREIGIRTALGATPRDIVFLIVTQGIVMAVSGLAIGLGVAAGVSRSLAGFLFGVTTFDLLTFVTVAVFLMLMTTVACAIPARRAAKIDPLTALKC